MYFKYSRQNRKLVELAKLLGLYQREVVGFGIPAGFTCPAANICQTYANRKTGIMSKGKHNTVTCFMSKLETAFPSLRKMHWYNFDLIRKVDSRIEIAEMLTSDIREMRAKVVRIHTSGDFYVPKYFFAWLDTAYVLPDVSFFGYTKQIMPFLYRDEWSDNFRLVFSHGSKLDAEACKMGIAQAYIVNDEAEAEALGVPMACPTSLSPNDYEYIMREESFALHLH